jgi:myo-inositol-1(or 4)-monophosphatase
MALYSATLNVMISAARKAGRRLTRDFNEVENLQVSKKGPADFVSAADIKSEETLRQELEQARPGYCFLLEEAGFIEGPDKTHCWIIDPLDGTTNFLHGLPHFAISVALEREGELVAAVIYNPITEELFVSEKGKGSFLNDRRLRVSARRDLGEALLATGIPFSGRPGHTVFQNELKTIMGRVAGIRRYGAASLDLAYVAAGRFDGFWERGLAKWDIAAGILMVREAGGLVMDTEGQRRTLETGNVVATNGELQKPLTDLLIAAQKS